MINAQPLTAEQVALLYERLLQAHMLGETPKNLTDMNAEVEEVLGRALND